MSSPLNFEKVAKAEEMLIMLIMLILWGRRGGPLPNPRDREKGLTF